MVPWSRSLAYARRRWGREPRAKELTLESPLHRAIGAGAGAAAAVATV